MPKVSVILPNYNHGKYLGLRFDSIVNQSFNDFEIIILDDASTDRSADIIQAWNDPRITETVFNKTNSGSTFRQWEKGISEARGEYIWIAESDDLADPDFLKTLVARLDSDPEIVVVFAASTWIDENNREIHQPPHETEKTWEPLEIIRNEFIRGNIIYNASAVVFRKEALKRVNFEEITSFRYAGDWLFWIQLIEDQKVSRVGERLNFFRRHEGNVSFKADKEGLQFKEGLKVVYYIFNLYSIPFFTKQKALLYWAKKMAESKIDDLKSILAEYPVILTIYTRFFKLISR